jgi:hypothetical protein
LRDLSYGKGKTSSVPGGKFPDLDSIEPWDGKDAEPPAPDAEDDLDLSDVELDDLEEEKVAAEEETQKKAAKKEEGKKSNDENKKKSEL